VAFFCCSGGGLLHTGTGFDLGTDTGLGLGGCKGGDAEGKCDKGGCCYDNKFFHGDAPSGGEIVNLTLLEQKACQIYNVPILNKLIVFITAIKTLFCAAFAPVLRLLHPLAEIRKPCSRP
jgi:hypothetical protein